MIREIIFSNEEKEKIEAKITSPTFCSKSWEDDDLASLKSRIKAFYLKEQFNTCVYCRVKIPSNHGRIWDIEHIMCRSLNSVFMFEPRNLCVSCVDCNSSKGDKPVTTSRAKQTYPIKFTIVHPHFDEYGQHIKIIEPGRYYIARTEKGEKTISTCRLNRFYAIADYSDGDIDLDEIQSLANQLSHAKTDSKKQEILRKLALISINNIQNN